MHFDRLCFSGTVIVLAFTQTTNHGHQIVSKAAALAFDLMSNLEDLFSFGITIACCIFKNIICSFDLNEIFLDPLEITISHSGDNVLGTLMRLKINSTWTTLTHFTLERVRWIDNF
jgi:hypothetical protein